MVAVSGAKPVIVETDPAVSPAAVPVKLVATPDVGVPRVGETRVGELAKTKAPDPVSSEIFPKSCIEVVAANWLKGLANKPKGEESTLKVT